MTASERTADEGFLFQDEFDFVSESLNLPSKINPSSSTDDGEGTIQFQ